MMRSLLAILAVISLACTNTVYGRVCRSGVNTTILELPLGIWDENDECSTVGEQSCFIGEISVPADFQKDNLTFIYGSCISSAYKSHLRCEQLLKPDGLNTDLLQLFLPQLGNLFSTGMQTLSERTAQIIAQFLKNENNELDNMRLVERLIDYIFKEMNVSVPDDIIVVSSELDMLITNALVNSSRLNTDHNGMLENFFGKDNPFDEARRLIDEILATNNISLPNEIMPFIDNFQSYISLLMQNESFVDATMYYMTSSIGGNVSTSALPKLMSLVRLLLSDNITLDANSELLLTTIVEMATKLTGDVDVADLNSWLLQWFEKNAITTNASVSFSNSILSAIDGYFPPDVLSNEWRKMIKYFPGYLYRFSDDHTQLDEVFTVMAVALDSSANPTSDLIELFSSNFSDLSANDVQGFVMSFTSLLSMAASNNLTQFGSADLASLQNYSMITEEAKQLTNAIVQLLQQFNISLDSELRHILQNTLGMMLTSVADENTQFISALNNISQTLNLFDMAGQDNEAIFRILASFIPEMYNFDKLVNSLPPLIQNLENGNYEYINQWQLDVLKSYSRITDATKEFSNSTLELFKRMGLYGNLTEDLLTVIVYVPGYLYNIIDVNSTSQFEKMLYNASTFIRNLNPLAPVSTSDFLDAFSLNISHPGLMNAIKAFDDFLNSRDFGNVTDLINNFFNSISVNMTQSMNDSTALLFNMLDSLNITIPEEYHSQIKSALNVVLASIPEYENEIVLILKYASEYISESTASKPSFDDIFAMIGTTINVEYNLNAFIESLSPLLSQLTIGNWGYISEWQINLLMNYSRITPATEALANATFELLWENGVTEYPEYIRSIIIYIPGFLYNFVDESSVVEYELVLTNISEILSNASTTRNEFQYLEEYISYNDSDPVVKVLYIILGSISNVTRATNLTDFGEEAFQALKTSSVITNTTSSFTSSLLKFLEMRNVTLPEPYAEIIEHIPGLFLKYFPDDADLIEVILINITSNLEANDPDNFNFDNLFEPIKAMIPAGYNTNALIDSLPLLLEQVIAGNFPYIQTWQIQLLSTYGLLKENTIDVDLIMKSLSVNTSDAGIQTIMSVLESILNIANSTSVEELAVEALNSLKKVASATNSSQELNTAIITFLDQFNVTMPTEYAEVAETAFGLFEVLFPGNKMVIHSIFSNLSLVLGQIDVASNDYNVIFGIINSMVTPDLKLQKFFQSLPSLLSELIQGNLEYINVWQGNLIIEYALVTNSTEVLANATLHLFERYGLDEIPSQEALIRSIPGYFYNFVPMESHPQLDLVFEQIASVLDITMKGELDIVSILNAYSFNTSNPDLQRAVDGIQIILNVAQARNLMDLGTEALESLKKVANPSSETGALTMSIVNFIEQFNVTVPVEYSQVIDNALALYISILPEDEMIIASIFNATSQVLDSFDTANPDFATVFNMIKALLPPSNNLSSLINTLPSLLQELLSGNNEYILTWQADVIASYSVVTPTTQSFTNTTLKLLSRYQSGSLPPYLTKLITYLPGFFYNLVGSGSQVEYDSYLASVTQILGLADPDSGSMIEEVLNSFPLNSTSPGVSEMINFLTSISNIISARNLTEFGVEAIKSLQSVAIVTSESNQFANSIIQLLQTMNMTIPEDYLPLLFNVPGLLGSSLPQQSEILKSIFTNISVALDQISTMNLNFTLTFQALANAIPEEYNQRILLESLPVLIEELRNNNPNYSNTWSLNLLRSYSRITPATEAFTNSTVTLITRLGSSSMINDDLKMFLTYIPGYLYNFVGNDTEMLDTVLYGLSQSLEVSTPPGSLNVGALLESFAVNSTDPTLILLLENLMDTMMSNNITEFGGRAMNILKTLSVQTNESSLLSASILDFMTQLNISIPTEFQDLINYVPALIITINPELKEPISLFYVQLASSFLSFDITESDNEQLITSISEVLMMLNVSEKMKSSIESSLLSVNASDPVGTFAGVINALSTAITQENNETAAILDTLPELLNQILAGNVSFLDTWNQNILKIMMPSLENLYQLMITESMKEELPFNLQKLLSDIQGINAAIMGNNQSAIDNWGNYMYQEYCASNMTLSKEFAGALLHTMNQYSYPTPSFMPMLLECIPPLVFEFMPNQTYVLSQVFSQIILANTNYSSYLNKILRDAGVALPPELNGIFDTLPSFQAALITGNFSHFNYLLNELQASFIKDTALSELIINIARKFNLMMSEPMEQTIQQISSLVYYPTILRMIPQVDIIFSSISVDIQSGADIGSAIMNALSKANATLSERFVPFFSNLEPILLGAFSGNMTALNKAVLDMLISYNASFPSYEVQYTISQYQLQMLLLNLDGFETIPKEVFGHIADMYRLSMKFSNLSEDFFKNLISEAYPESAQYMSILFKLPSEFSIRFIYNFSLWIFTPDRNLTILTEHIQSLIEKIFDEQKLEMSDVLESLTSSLMASCKYETCEEDHCNTYDLLYPVVTSTTSLVTTTPYSSTTSEARTTMGTTIEVPSQSSTTKTTETLPHDWTTIVSSDWTTVVSSDWTAVVSSDWTTTASSTKSTASTDSGTSTSNTMPTDSFTTTTGTTSSIVNTIKATVSIASDTPTTTAMSNASSTTSAGASSTIAITKSTITASTSTSPSKAPSTPVIAETAENSVTTSQITTTSGQVVFSKKMSRHDIFLIVLFTSLNYLFS